MQRSGLMQKKIEEAYFMNADRISFSDSLTQKDTRLHQFLTRNSNMHIM